VDFDEAAFAKVVRLVGKMPTLLEGKTCGQDAHAP